MSETQETALERRLEVSRRIMLLPSQAEVFHEKDAEAQSLARDLVRCWRQYLAAWDVMDDPSASDAETEAAGERYDAAKAEARALLARGDAHG